MQSNNTKPTNPNPIKKIKVSEGYFKKPEFKNQRELIPAIKLNGKYLKNLGFNVHDEIEIFSPQNGILEIRKV